MVMPGQVLDNCTACLRSFSAATRISAAFLRSASDIMMVIRWRTPARHGRTCCGHPCLVQRAFKTWMPVTSTGMTVPAKVTLTQLNCSEIAVLLTGRAQHDGLDRALRVGRPLSLALQPQRSIAFLGGARVKQLTVGKAFVLAGIRR